MLNWMEKRDQRQLLYAHIVYSLSFTFRYINHVALGKFNSFTTEAFGA